MNKTAVYCQNCRARNSLAESHCLKCGTRLLLVVFPQSLQFDTNQVPSFYEDHLLERVSLLELRLGQVSESLRMAMEIIREQGQALKDARREPSTNAAPASNAGPIKETAGNALTADGGAEGHGVSAIVAAHDGSNGALVGKLAAEAARLFAGGEDREGLRMVERAAMLSPRNLPLHFLGARLGFGAERHAETVRLLDHCHALAPDDLDVMLFRGVLYADAGDAEQARLHLGGLAEAPRAAALVNLVWALLAFREGRAEEAFAAFKVASSSCNAPEIQYLAGCVAYESGNNASALAFLQKAISLDRKYADAWFMQAAVYGRQGDPREANMLANAAEVRDAAAQCASLLKKKESKPEVALPFAHLRPGGTKRVLTGGARRVAALVVRLLDEALGAAEEKND